MSKKISAFTELATQPATGDFFLLELASNGQYRKIKYSNLLADGAVTAAKIATNAVDYSKINFGGSGHGVWWEEIGRTTLTVAGTSMSVAGLPARTYLRIIINLIPSGTLSPDLYFNNDTGANYAMRFIDTGGAAGTSLSRNNIAIDRGTLAQTSFTVADVVNITAQEKVAKITTIWQGAAGAANAPDMREQYSKWANTAAQINRVDVMGGGAGNMAIGSEIIVLGHN